MGVYFFPKYICPKVNIISHYSTGIPLLNSTLSMETQQFLTVYSCKGGPQSGKFTLCLILSIVVGLDKYFGNRILCRECPCSVMVKAMDCRVVGS